MASMYHKMFPAKILKLASKMVTVARGRCRKKKWDFNLTVLWACEKLTAGRCEMTGVKFVFDKGISWHRNWPSIDRIDSRLGYTDNNCQMVTLQFNIAKGSWTNREMVEFCRLVVAKGSRKKSPKRKLPLELSLGVDLSNHPEPANMAAFEDRSINLPVAFIRSLQASGVRAPNSLYD